MSNYKNVDLILHTLNEMLYNQSEIDSTTIKKVIGIIQDVPTSDVEEIIYANWIINWDEATCICSHCGHEYEDRGDTIFDYWKRCPDCGAKMLESRKQANESV